MSIPWLDPDGPIWFPPADCGHKSGLLAAGGDLAPERLLYAYSKGIFPWYDSSSPILWWSPDPRCVLYPGNFYINRSLAKVLRRKIYEVSFNKSFADVICNCARASRPGQNGTWLLPEMIEAYIALHRLGHAWSVEVWHEAELAGGVYGVQVGRVLFGESMFHLRPNASKVALAALVAFMREKDFLLLDCQQTTLHMQCLGAREIPRSEFLSQLDTQPVGHSAS